MGSAPVGVWLVATAALGWPVPAGEPYPCICYHTAYSGRGVPVVIRPRECAAYHQREEAA